jgi:hypothetical protein
MAGDDPGRLEGIAMRMGSWLSALLVAGLAVGCATSSDEPEVEAPSAVDEAEKAEAQAVSTLGGRLEQALRAVDRGEDIEAARATFDAVIADRTATTDQRDEARLGLSRALEALGDDEGAVVAVETLLASHVEDGQFAARDAAEKRLRLLLTGKPEGDTYRLPRKDPLPPAAIAMSKLFDADADGRVLVDIAIFGGPGRTRSDAFEVADAKREEYALMLGKNGWVGQSISQSGNWLALPQVVAEKRADMPQANRSLLVFFYDLDNNRVPSRYDAYLPMPSDEIAAVLERGEGLVVARKREGAKPTIVIAAPRAGQLAAVEEAFAKMSELPYEPVKVPLKEGLMSEEIQSRVRGSFGEVRTCYEELLGRDRKAEGKLVLSFVIAADGKVSEASMTEGTTLEDRKLQECVLGHARKLTFPAVGKSTTVTYPIAMSP